MQSKIYWDVKDKALFKQRLFTNNLTKEIQYNRFTKKLYAVRNIINTELHILPLDICDMINEYIDCVITVECNFNKNIHGMPPLLRFNTIDINITDDYNFFSDTFNTKINNNFFVLYTKNKYKLILRNDNNLQTTRPELIGFLDVSDGFYYHYMDKFYNKNMFENKYYTKLNNEFDNVKTTNDYSGYFKRNNNQLEYVYSQKSTEFDYDIIVKNNRILKHFILILHQIMTAIV